jgi:predicted O-linked N-acetylglucosamine transferase (SPINDLY family)
LDEAAELLERATSLEPNHAAYQANLGEVYRRLGRLPEAVDALMRATSCKPVLAEPIYNLGLIAQGVGDMASALECFEQAAELKPGAADIVLQREAVRRALSGEGGRQAGTSGRDAPTTMLAVAVLHALAHVKRALGRVEDVVALYMRARALDSRFFPTHIELGDALIKLWRLDEAVASYRAAVELYPRNTDALNQLAGALLWVGLADEAVASLRRSLAIKSDAKARSLLLFAMPYEAGCDDAAILEEARVWDREFAAPLTACAEACTTERSPDRRLRIGYVSRDFREHVHFFFLEPLLSNHDRHAVEVFLYSDVRQPDQDTEGLRGFGDHWRDIASLDDQATAARVRDDGIDILVDLTMHGEENRLLAFARKPAPIQVCWLAYPGTTGLSAMDYRVTDPYLDPPDIDQRVYAEQPLYLPDTFWCYTPRTSAPEVNSLPAAASGRVTFGCLNNFAKLNSAVFELWARILIAVPGSKLILLAPPGEARRRALAAFARSGVEEARIEFVDRRARPEYLALYQRIDVCLDPFPCCGHTTSFDAFWMGVPVVTLVGRTVLGRAGRSLAMNLAMPELVAKSPDEYVRSAVALCEDIARLSDVRTGLRPRMEASPLMDGPRFARSLEAGYRRIWRAWCDDPSSNMVSVGSF